MKRLALKNIITFAAELPEAQELARHLPEYEFRELGESDKSGAGFIKDPITGEWVNEVPGGFAICMRVDTKVLPSSVIVSHLDKRITSYEEKEGRKVDRATKADLRERVVFELLKTAHPRTELIQGFYHRGSGRLYVSTSSHEKASGLVKMLVRAVGTVTTKTIHFDGMRLGLTTRLADWLAGDEGSLQAPFGPFSLGMYCLLTRDALEGPKETVVYRNVYLDGCPEIADYLARGYQVEELELETQGLSFRINQSFQMKGLDWPKSDDDMEDAKATWKHNAGAKMFLLDHTVRQLAGLFTTEEEQDDLV